MSLRLWHNENSLRSGNPDPLRHHLSKHSVSTAYEKGWADLSNGHLLTYANEAGFNVLITTDQNLIHQQNLSNYKIAIVVLLSTSWPKINKNVGEIVTTIESVSLGSYTEIPI